MIRRSFLGRGKEMGSEEVQVAGANEPHSIDDVCTREKRREIHQ